MKKYFYLFFYYFGKILGDFVYNIKFKNKNKLSLKNKKFIFNRCDLIGDAIVTLPFLLALKKKGIEFEVLCSEYNEWVLKPFVKTKILNLNNTKLKDKIKDLFYLPYNLLFKKPKNVTEIIFFDLGKSYYLSKKYTKKYFCVHCIDPVMNILFSDYVVNDYYVTFGKKQLVEKYKMLFEENGVKLDIEEFPKEIDEYITKNHDPKIDEIIKNHKNFIIVYIGNKDFRNFTSDEWKEIIESIKYNGDILVIDDPSNKRAKELKNLIKKNNVYVIENKYNLWSLMYLTKFADWVIGIDGGGFNFLQIPTNAIGIYFYTNVETWKPFSNNPYKIKYYDKKEKIKVIETITSKGNVKKVIYVDENEIIKSFYEKNNIFNGKLKTSLFKFLKEKDIIKR